MLDAKASSQVCGQCHGVWLYTHSANDRRPTSAASLIARATNISDARAGAAHRPAAPALQKRHRRGYPDYLKALFWSDGMIRYRDASTTALSTPLFRQGTERARTLSCFSCHTIAPGGWRSSLERRLAATHQVSAGMGGNEACLQCHSKFRTNLSAHTKHQQEIDRQLLLQLHMPYTTYGLLKG